MAYDGLRTTADAHATRAGVASGRGPPAAASRNGMPPPEPGCRWRGPAARGPGDPRGRGADQADLARPGAVLADARRDRPPRAGPGIHEPTPAGGPRRQAFHDLQVPYDGQPERLRRRAGLGSSLVAQTCAPP